MEREMEGKFINHTVGIQNQICYFVTQLSFLASTLLIKQSVKVVMHYEGK